MKYYLHAPSNEFLKFKWPADSLSECTIYLLSAAAQQVGTACGVKS